MRKISVSSTLVVRFDGQFWVGIVERVEDGQLSACRVVFGAEPSCEEILDFVLHKWTQLTFSEPVSHRTRALAENPKRRQREVARELRRRGPSTKAQLALAEQREAQTREIASRKREEQNEKRVLRFMQKRDKAKRKRRGH